jgi:2-polyprenyl-3-methyl-5-hydroxy-6-metoxy-1,4-benzoquinol methylase
VSLNQQLRKFLVRFPSLFKWINRILPEFILRRLRTLAEKIKYSDVSEVHELPEIFDYWSQKYVRPLLTELGYQSLQDFFVQHILRFADKPCIRVMSIGAGNCELDLALVAQLKALGYNNLRYECLEINSRMLQRASNNALELGLEDLMVFTEQNIEDWEPGEQPRHNVIICRQFLHHVVQLEALMFKLKQAMEPHALLLVDDMVGRNGHMRWPEALTLVEGLWADLPEQYKYHHLHGVTNKRYKNWDCSITGYEGIRAQDILPLLLKYFQFDTFIAFANVIDVFVDRPYGPNFSVDNPDDLVFIDRVQRLDRMAIERGQVKPTHMIAAMQLEPVKEVRCCGHVTPEFAVRPPG